MDSLLANCLPFLSDHLQVQDLIRLESVSKFLHDTIRQDATLFHRAIRANVGYENEYPSTVPVKKFKDEEESKWKGYSAQSYPARACFHAKLKHNGIKVEDLSGDKIREMGQCVARIREEFKKGAPTVSSDEEETVQNVDECWDKWRAPGYLGLRGGYISLDFKVVCGFVLVCSVREQHEYKHQYGYEYYHGFWDESSQSFQYALERRTVPLRSNDDIPHAYVPYDYYVDGFDGQGDGLETETDRVPNGDADDGPEEWERLNQRRRQIDVWCLGSFSEDSNKPKIKWLKDASKSIFAITMGRQLLRRVVQDPQNSDRTVLQELAGDQGEIAKKFLAPFVWARGATEYNANKMLGMDVTLEEYEAIKASLEVQTSS